MKYKIVDELTSNALQTKVNVLLKDGWKLQGGASVAIYGANQHFIQAMIKEPQ